MSVNRYQPHVWVLPVDDANRQIANGFVLDPNVQNYRIQVLDVVDGWNEVIKRFLSDHVAGMEKYETRYMILVLDLDDRLERLEQVIERVPGHLTGRVFILRALSEPEDLKPDLGSYETIGLAMARDCREQTATTWGHDLLRHNQGE